ncbi:MAG: amidohydrolase family protein [Candidatus Geothermarchaeales archaeon]
MRLPEEASPGHGAVNKASAKKDEVIDVHIHPLVGEEELLAEMDRAEVSQGVLLAMDVDPKRLDLEEIRGVVLQRLLDSYVWDAPRVEGEMRRILSLAKVTNSAVAEMVDRHPKRFIGFGSVDVTKGKQYVREKLNEIKGLNLRGVKISPTLQFFNPVRSKESRLLWRLCEGEGLIITCHTGCDPGPWEVPGLSEDANPRRLEPLLKTYDTRVILAHMGSYSSARPGIWLEEALAMGGRHDEVWVDLSAVTFMMGDEGVVERLRETIGLDRVLFGSDYPVVQGASVAEAVNHVRESPFLTVREKGRILRDNARDLLKIS